MARGIPAIILVCLSSYSVALAQNESPKEIVPVDRPQVFDQPQVGVQLVASSNYIRAPLARTTFGVNGAGLTVAVLDTGLRISHVDFTGRVPTQQNYTPDNGGDVNDATDGNGHGCNVAGIIAANNLHVGIAPGARIIPIKVLRNSGSGSFDSIKQALDWVIGNHSAHDISVVNMSLGDSGNYQDDNFGSDEIQQRIQSLRQLRIPVVVSAGNGFFNHGSAEGMSYPGIFRETVSAGAFYDADEGPFSYASGAQAFSTGPGRFTPFSQRLHSSTNGSTKTDIFGPGAPVTSAGHTSDTAESIQHGTSQAAPIISGVLLLTQEYHRRQTGSLPSVNDLELWMEQGATNQLDGDDEDDNVTNTDKSYPQVDAFRTIEASQRSIQRDLLFKGGQSTYSKH